MNRWWILVFLGMIWSCQPKADRQEKKIIDTYYDINGLVEGQVKLLDSISPFLIKTGQISGNAELDTIRPDREGWENEMDIIKSADINKTMLTDSYGIIEKNIDGLPATIYISKSPKTTFADSIALQFSHQGTKLFAMYASLATKNVLFQSNKSLVIYFDTTSQKNMLKSMKVDGWQKMVLKDTTNFSVFSEVIYR